MRPTALAQLRFPVEPEQLEAGSFAAEVVAGLSATPKRLPPKFFYDSAGSDLFERITDFAGILSDALRTEHLAGARRRNRGAYPGGRGID